MQNKFFFSNLVFFSLTLFIVSSFIFVAFSGSATADLSCAMSNSCSGTSILGVKNDTGGYNDAHSQLANYTPAYSYGVCCSSTTQTVGANCSAPKSAEFLRLYATTNSHVQAVNNSLSVIYNNAACLSGTGKAFCTISEGSCSAPYTCVASIASSETNGGEYNYTNDHISECSYYDLKVCCYLNSVPSQGTPILNSTSGTNHTNENLTVYAQSPNDADSNIIYWNYDWRKSNTSVAVLNMPFNSNVSENTTNAVADFSTYGNNGTLGGGDSNKMPIWSNSGEVGGAYSFDGVNDYIKVSNSPEMNITDNITLSAWVKTKYIGTEQKIMNREFSVSQGYELFLDAGGHAYFRLGTTGSTTSPVLSADQWYYVVGTFDKDAGSNNIKLYINGILNSSSTGTGSITDYENDLYIGTRESATAPFNGTIDEVKIYNYSLSPEQIKANYEAGLAGHGNNILVSQETNKGDYWSAAATPSDVYDDGLTKSSNEVYIQNGIPVVPTLIYPVNETIEDRYPAFNWTTITDEDGDPITYEINVTSPSGLNCFGFTDTNLSDSNKTSTTELCTNLDYSTGSYFWNVRACDPLICGAWSDTALFNVTSVQAISIISNNVSFGAIERNESNNTLSNNPQPLIVQNDGNIRLNISSRATTNLFNTYPNLNDSSFQFEAGVNESNSFNEINSATSWLNVTNESTILVSTLNYLNSSDDARIDLNVTIPYFEPAGAKQTTLEISSYPDSPS